MTRSDQEIPVLRLPEKLSANYGSFSPTDKLIVLPILGVLSFAMLVFYGALAWIVSLAVAAILMYRLTYGRIIYLIWQQLIIEPWLRVVKGDVLWQASGKRRKLLRSSPVIDLEVNALGPVGLLHNRVAGTDAIIVTGTGSNIAEQGIAAMHQLHAQLAEVVKRIAMLPGYSIGVSFTFRTRQADIIRTMEMYDGVLHPDALHGETSNLSRLVEELIDLEAGTDSEVTMASIWTIRRESELAAAARGRRASEFKPDHLTISQVAEAVADNLHHFGITGVHLLNANEVEDYLRTAWDTTNLPDWYAWRSLDSSEQAAVPDEEQPDHWPSTVIKRGWKHCQLDGSYHSVLIATGTPRESWANFYHQLHNLPVPSPSVTIAGEAVKGSREGRVLDAVIPISESFFDVFGIRMNPKRRARMESLEEREASLYASRFSHSYHLLVDVTAGSLEELEDNVSAVLREIRLLGFEAQRITGRGRQLPAMWSATTGSNML